MNRFCMQGGVIKLGYIFVVLHFIKNPFEAFQSYIGFNMCISLMIRSTTNSTTHFKIDLKYRDSGTQQARHRLREFEIKVSDQSRKIINSFDNCQQLQGFKIDVKYPQYNYVPLQLKQPPRKPHK